MNESRARVIVLLIIAAALVIGVGVYVVSQKMWEGTDLEEREQAQIRSAKLSQTPIEPDPSVKGGQKQVKLSPAKDIQAQRTGAGTNSLPASADASTGRREIEQTPKTAPAPAPVFPTEKEIISDTQLKSALSKAEDSENYESLGKILAEIYKKYPQGKKDFTEIESRAYVKATSYLDQEKNIAKALAAANAVYSKYPFGWRFKYLRVRVLERLGRDAFNEGNLAASEKYAYAMLQMEFRPEGANLMADIYLKRIDEALAKGDTAGAKAAYEEIKDYEVSKDRREVLDERADRIQ